MNSYWLLVQNKEKRLQSFLISNYMYFILRRLILLGCYVKYGYVLNYFSLY